MLEQSGGPQGELAAAMRYFTQALSEDDPGRKDMLLDIATEELSRSRGDWRGLRWNQRCTVEAQIARLITYRSRPISTVPTPSLALRLGATAGNAFALWRGSTASVAKQSLEVGRHYRQSFQSSAVARTMHHIGSWSHMHFKGRNERVPNLNAVGWSLWRKLEIALAYADFDLDSASSYMPCFPGTTLSASCQRAQASL
jgi:hypothetical protein